MAPTIPELLRPDARKCPPLAIPHHANFISYRYMSTIPSASITPKLSATMNALIIFRAKSLILDGNLVDKKLDNKL